MLLVGPQHDHRERPARDQQQRAARPTDVLRLPEGDGAQPEADQRQRRAHRRAARIGRLPGLDLCADLEHRARRVLDQAHVDRRAREHRCHDQGQNAESHCDVPVPQAGPYTFCALSSPPSAHSDSKAQGAGVIAATDTIPVIDLGPTLAGEPGALDRAAKELRFALTEIGFYFIVNHGMPEAQVRDIYRQAARFHALPARREDESAHRPAQCRLPADARRHAAHLDRAGRHQGQSQRGAVHRPRPAGRSSRRDRRPALPQRQPMAPGTARLPRVGRGLLRRPGAAAAEADTGLRPRARPAGVLFRRAVPRLPVQAPHDPLSAAGHAGGRRVRHRPRTPIRVS